MRNNLYNNAKKSALIIISDMINDKLNVQVEEQHIGQSVVQMTLELGAGAGPGPGPGPGIVFL